MKIYIRKFVTSLAIMAVIIGFMGCKPEVEEHKHTFSEEYVFDEAYHWHAAICDHFTEVADKEEHIWDDGVVTKVPTESTEGEKTYKCNVCKATKIESISKLDHTHKYAINWTSDEKYHWHAATCEHYTEVSDKAVHTFNGWIILKQPTEETEGSKERSCVICSYKATENIEKLKHVHAKGIHHNAVVGTCNTKGTLEYFDCVKDKCTVKLDASGNVLYSIEGELNPSKHEGTATIWNKTATTHKETYVCCGAVKIAASAHTWNEGVVTKTATEDTEGILEYTCNICEATKTEVIAKLPHIHTFSSAWANDSVYHWHAATCAHSTEVSSKAIHTWNKGVVTKEPTAILEGKKLFTCTICKKTKTEVIAKLPASSYNWFSSPIDAETGLAATKSSTYLLFGVFPRTIKGSEVTVDETESVIMGVNTYYKGSDGEYYAKIKAKPNDSSYTYSDGTTVTSSVAFFKVEPIKWKVLTTNYNGTNKVLLLAEEILTANVPYYVGKEQRYSSSKIVYPNNYEYSTIRAYLNGKYEDDDTQSKITYSNKGFLQTAFTSSAQSKIAITKVYNNGDSTSDAAGTRPKADGTSEYCKTDFTCGYTEDKIFLLSEKEVTTVDFGFDVCNSSGKGNKRIRLITDYAKANNTWQASVVGYGGDWWLRSPDYRNRNGNSVQFVSETGSAINSCSVDFMSTGIVPALTISL